MSLGALLHFNAALQQYFDFSYSGGVQTSFPRLIWKADTLRCSRNCIKVIQKITPEGAPSSLFPLGVGKMREWNSVVLRFRNVFKGPGGSARSIVPPCFRRQHYLRGRNGLPKTNGRKMRTRRMTSISRIMVPIMENTAISLRSSHGK